MPPISNINNVSTGRSYTGTTLNDNRNSEQSGEQFSVAGAPKQEQLQSINEKNAGNNAQTTMGQKDLIPLAVTSTKNQTLAVETVKDIINTDLLNTAKLNGYTELVGELEQLSASLYIPAKDLIKEITEQEKQNTMFSGDKFYDLLRELAEGADDDTKEAIGNMLKAINFSQNRNEITTAVSSNLRFLAEYFSPNRNLSGRLNNLADMWSRPDAQQNFKELRGQTADLMQNLSESLLNDSHTQTLLPIVTHNLSKFNTNSSMLREYFGQLLTQVPSYEMRNELSKSFEVLIGKLFKNDPMFENYGYDNNSLNDYTTNEMKNQVQNTNFGNEYQANDKISSYLTEKLGDNNYIAESGVLEKDFSAFINRAIDEEITPKDAITAMLSSVVDDEDVQQVLQEELENLDSPEQIVDYLNGFLEAVPDGELRDKLYESLEEAVLLLEQYNTAEQEEEQAAQPQKKLSSIQALTQFVEKNINHPALKSIDSFNASNLLQSMINAPGVMTPLAHYILPIQIENTRAFGELWVDNDDDSGATGSGGGSHHHLFLTFDVDTYGRFEVDVFANDSTVRVSLLHPTSFARNIDSVVAKINRIAANTKYNIADFKTGVLKEPHNLTQIFPKLGERRSGLNVKA